MRWGRESAQGTVGHPTAGEYCSVAVDPPTTESTRVPSLETEGEILVYSPRCQSPLLQPLLGSHRDRVEAAISKPNSIGVLKDELWDSPGTCRMLLMDA